MSLLLALLGSLWATEPAPEPPPEEEEVLTVEVKQPRSLIDTSGSQDMAWGPRMATFGGVTAGCAASWTLGYVASVALDARTPGRSEPADILPAVTIGPLGCLFGSAALGRAIHGRDYGHQLRGVFVGHVLAMPVFLGSATATTFIYVYSDRFGLPFPLDWRSDFGLLTTLTLWLPPFLVYGAWATRAADRAPLAAPRVVPIAGPDGTRGLALALRF